MTFVSLAVVLVGSVAVANCPVEFGTRTLAENVATPVREVLEDFSLGPWTLTFMSECGTRTLENLKVPLPLTELPELVSGAHVGSNTVVYVTSFTLRDRDDLFGRRGEILLDLGKSDARVNVFVNDRLVRNLYGEPYVCDLASAVQIGRNAVKIEIENVRPNSAGLRGPVTLRRIRFGSSRFISPVAKGPCASAAVFERRFIPRAPVSRACWRFSALGVFDAFVNGTRAGNDFLKPGFTESGKCRHVYTADVTSLIREGCENVLSATVTSGWWNDEMMVASTPRPWQTGEEVAFWGELDISYADGTQEMIPTDLRWMASYSGPVVAAGIYEGETIDADRVPARFRPVRVNDEFHGELRPAAAKVTLRTDLEMKPVSILRIRGTEGARDGEYGRAKVVAHYSADEEIHLARGESVVVDFGQNCAAVPSFDAMGEPPPGEPCGKLTVRHGEMLNEENGELLRGNDGPAGIPYLASLRTAQAAYVITPSNGVKKHFRPNHTFFGYRYLLLTTDEKVVVSRFRSTPVSSLTSEMERGRIITGDERVNRLIENIRWSLLSNYLSIPTDCPQRDERMGWTADAQVFMKSASYLVDTREFLLKYLSDLEDAQYPDGLYPCFAPNVKHLFPHWAAAGWTDAGIIIPYRLWKWTGDLEIVKKCWSSMERYMRFLESDPSPYRINFGDWLAFEHCAKREDGSDGEEIDPAQAVVFNAYFRIWMTQLMKEMASAMGRQETSCRYAHDERRLRDAFKRSFLGDDGCLLTKYRGQCNDLYMLKLGLCGDAVAAKETTRDLLENLKSHGNCLQTGFMGTAIFLPTLTFDAGAADMAYTLLLQDKFPSWLYSVDQGATTVWERWNAYTKEKGFGPVIMNSFNHYAYGCALEWLFAAAAGIRPDPNGGWRHFVLKPYPDRRLKSCDASYRSDFGMIRSAWRFDGDRLIWKFSIPPGSSATVTEPNGQLSDRGPGDYERAY